MRQTATRVMVGMILCCAAAYLWSLSWLVAQSFPVNSLGSAGESLQFLFFVFLYGPPLLLLWATSQVSNSLKYGIQDGRWSVAESERVKRIAFSRLVRLLTLLFATSPALWLILRIITGTHLPPLLLTALASSIPMLFAATFREVFTPIKKVAEWKDVIKPIQPSSRQEAPSSDSVSTQKEPSR